MEIYSIDNEQVIWEETPSHWTKANVYILSFLLAVIGIGIILFFVTYLKIKYTKYKLTNQRLTITTGIFSRKMETIELYRFKDLKYEASFLNRIVGIGNIQLVSSDPMTPNISLNGFKYAQSKCNQLRSLIEKCRINRGVREFDQIDHRGI